MTSVPKIIGPPAFAPLSQHKQTNVDRAQSPDVSECDAVMREVPLTATRHTAPAKASGTGGTTGFPNRV